MNIPKSNLKRIVVIGSGFAGIQFIKNLNVEKYQIVLLDKHNYHTFQPLLYQVATAGLEPDSIAYTVRHIFEKEAVAGNFYFRIAKINKIEASTNTIFSDIGTLTYDKLVISTGSKTNYYGNENIEKFAMSMKTIPEALDLRSLILHNFEDATVTNNEVEKERLMNYVIVGAGPTGVELAGSLAELKNHVLPNDYPELDIKKMNIHLVDATDRVLVSMSEEASKNAQKYLEEMGVNIHFGIIVKDYDGTKVITNKQSFETNTLIWSAGVTGNLIFGINNTSQEKGRYLVDEHNKIINHNNVYAIGDVALMKSDVKFANGHPMVAQVAMQQGKNLANNLANTLNNKPLNNFIYNDRGSMATIGRNKAVVDLDKIKFKGFFAWIVWMFVHLVSLVGFRNKVVALINWLIQYFSYDKHVRLIIRPFKRKVFEEVTSFRNID
ncbi:MAG: NAD(P)/FAD-dependent oxidoreductase [Solirubrobacteraceae bacterium]